MKNEQEDVFNDTHNLTYGLQVQIVIIKIIIKEINDQNLVNITH